MRTTCNNNDNAHSTTHFSRQRLLKHTLVRKQFNYSTLHARQLHKLHSLVFTPTFKAASASALCAVCGPPVALRVCIDNFRWMGSVRLSGPVCVPNDTMHNFNHHCVSASQVGWSRAIILSRLGAAMSSAICSRVTMIFRAKECVWPESFMCPTIRCVLCIGTPVQIMHPHPPILLLPRLCFSPVCFVSLVCGFVCGVIVLDSLTVCYNIGLCIHNDPIQHTIDIY